MNRTLQIVSVVTMVFFACLALIAFWSQKDEDLARLIDEADPGPSWTLIDSSDEPRRLMCLGSNPCPSSYRRWESTTPVTVDEMRNLLPSHAEGTVITGDCVTVPTGIIGYGTGCEVTFTAGGYDFWMHQDVSSEPSEPAVLVATGEAS